MSKTYLLTLTEPEVLLLYNACTVTAALNTNDAAMLNAAVLNLHRIHVEWDMKAEHAHKLQAKFERILDQLDPLWRNNRP